MKVSEARSYVISCFKPVIPKEDRILRSTISITCLLSILLLVGKGHLQGSLANAKPNGFEQFGPVSKGC